MADVPGSSPALASVPAGPAALAPSALETPTGRQRCLPLPDSFLVQLTAFKGWPELVPSQLPANTVHTVFTGPAVATKNGDWTFVERVQHRRQDGVQIHLSKMDLVDLPARHIKLARVGALSVHTGGKGEVVAIVVPPGTAAVCAKLTDLDPEDIREGEQFAKSEAGADAALAAERKRVQEATGAWIDRYRLHAHRLSPPPQVKVDVDLRDHSKREQQRLQQQLEEAQAQAAEAREEVGNLKRKVKALEKDNKTLKSENEKLKSKREGKLQPAKRQRNEEEEREAEESEDEADKTPKRKGKGKPKQQAISSPLLYAAPMTFAQPPPFALPVPYSPPPMFVQPYAQPPPPPLQAQTGPFYSPSQSGTYYPSQQPQYYPPQH